MKSGEGGEKKANSIFNLCIFVFCSMNELHGEFHSFFSLSRSIFCDQNDDDDDDFFCSLLSFLVSGMTNTVL